MWTVNLNVAAGAHQGQAMAAISYPIKLASRPTAIFRNEAETALPKAPCQGEVEKPVAEKGFLCVYTGGQGLGSKESEKVNAAFFGFESPKGEHITATNAKGEGGGKNKGGFLGELAIFRTEEYNETSPENIASQAYLDMGGSWAVTAP